MLSKIRLHRKQKKLATTTTQENELIIFLREWFTKNIEPVIEEQSNKGLWDCKFFKSGTSIGSTLLKYQDFFCDLCYHQDLNFVIDGNVIVISWYLPYLIPIDESEFRFKKSEI
jgi:hypothetical protein